MNPMHIKPEGQPFPIEEWEPEHPAKDCEARFWASVDATEGDRHHLYGTGIPPYAARGDAWRFGIYIFACYMRINGCGFFDHYHDCFIDPDRVRQLVYDGHGDDKFKGVKFTAKQVPIEMMPKGTTLGPQPETFPESRRTHLPPHGEKPTR